MRDWLTHHWVACALTMGLMLLLLTPVLATVWTAPFLLLYLQLPVYMIHQVEEHWGDRFRQFVNQKVFGGYEALSPASILVINIPGVWGINLLSLYAATFLGLGWGLAGVYLTLVNGVAHIAAAFRGYNPGLWTALALFLPVSGLALKTVSQSPEVAGIHHAVGLGSAIGIHAAIVGYAKSEVRRIRRSQ